jgi:hypothetical protein
MKKLASWVVLLAANLIGCGGGDSPGVEAASKIAAPVNTTPKIKILSVSADSSITLQDAIAVLKMIVGLEVNPDGAPSQIQPSLARLRLNTYQARLQQPNSSKSKRLLNLPGRLIPAVLVKHYMCYLAFVVFDKSHLSVHHFYEKVRFGLSEQVKLFLAGRLREKLIAFAAKREDESWRKLIFANISVKNLWIKFDCFAVFRRFNFG